MTRRRLHDKGGSDRPYEKYHVSRRVRERLQDKDGCDGLMPSDIFAENEKVSPPGTSSDPGEPGQWALDDNYLYYCMQPDSWRRILLYIITDLAYLLTEDGISLAFEDDSLWELEGTF